MQNECKPNAMQCKPNAMQCKNVQKTAELHTNRQTEIQSKVFVSLSKRSGLNGFYYPQKS